MLPCYLEKQVQHPLQHIDEVDCADVSEAVKKGHVGCLQYLTQQSDTVLAVNSEQQTPFHMIEHRAESVCHERTGTLLAALSFADAAAAVNTADATGNTALHFTVGYQTDNDVTEYSYEDHHEYNDDDFTVCDKCICALLAAGADPTVQNKAGYSAATIAAVLAAASVGSHTDDHAVLEQHILTIKALQRAGADINVTHTARSRTLYHLHDAAGADSELHSLGAVKVLLQCGADVMLRNGQGWTALHCAAYRNGNWSKWWDDNAPIIQALYDAGGDTLLHDTTPTGQTALHLATQWPQSVQKLCELGARVDVRDDAGRTPLHTVTHCEGQPCSTVIASLLAAAQRADLSTSDLVNAADNDGNTALHMCYDELLPCQTCIRALLAAEAKPAVENNDGVQAVSIPQLLAVAHSARDETVVQECELTIRALQQAGADINKTHYASSDRTESHLHTAAGVAWSYCSDRVVRLLLDCGADVMQRDSSGWTALHWAAHYEGGAYYSSSFAQGNASVIVTLYEAGGNLLLHAATRDGQTALHLAALWSDSVR
jgi:ankyrin repeat protein